MPPHSCIYCGRRIGRKCKGRSATADQYKQAVTFHHPDPVLGDYICSTHQAHPPNKPLTSTSRKRKRDSVPDATTPASVSHIAPSPQAFQVTAFPSDFSHDHSAPSPPPSASAQSSTEPYLVNPFQQALANSKQPVRTSSIGISNTTVTSPLCKIYRDKLFDSMLAPHHRHTHMTHVVTSMEHTTSTDTTIAGHYLRVFDVHTDHALLSQSNTNLLQELIESTSQPITSKPAHPAQHLQQALPFTTPTYTQKSYCQYTIPSTTNSPPVIHSIPISRQSDAYARLVEASSAATSAMRDPQSTTTSTRLSRYRNIFTPSISIDSIKDDTIKQHLKTIATSVQQHYKQHVPHKHLELECNHVFSTPLDGFGIEGLQLYAKVGEAVTPLHDETLWCSALNYMLPESIGYALWIAVGLHDLKQVMSIQEIDDLLHHQHLGKTTMEIGALLDTLIKTGARIEYAFQGPNHAISSPPGIGAMHLVYSQGLLTTQLAWNYSFTIPGAIECLAFWDSHDKHHRHESDGGSMATRSVIPLYTMQQNGYELNLADEMQAYQDSIAQLQQSSGGKHVIQLQPKKARTYCPKCLYRQDWVCIDGKCIHCHFNKPQ
jgi:hypothetical protein